MTDIDCNHSVLNESGLSPLSEDRNKDSGEKNRNNELVFPENFHFPGIYRDILTPDDIKTPHWQGLIGYFNSLGRTELERRWRKARQIMREHGAAYNIFNNEHVMERPWELDPVPCPVSTETWKLLEKGIQQRTRLLTAIYNDIYSNQTLVINNHIPPELIFANPKFLRQCHNLRKKNSSLFHLHATDLCRSADGKWMVLSDRTQAPAGAGYALENRIILSRILPRMFHSGKVLRLAPFFKQLTHALMDISGLDKREPNIVMLSQGPSSPTYFEHVFLSRYLGITLVESSDLTVRNDSVFLKTLGGLHPVDVILREIEDTLCDPLIFDNRSVVGIPGLVQAVRSGNVSVANPLGSGVLETPGLIPFLPQLCRILLGEELIIDDMPTTWCGNLESCRQVLDCMENKNVPLIISSSFSGPNEPVAVNTYDMSRKDIADLAGRIKKTPYAFIAKKPVETSALPVWQNGRVKNCCAALRMFSTLINASQSTAGQEKRSVENGPVENRSANDMQISVMPGALTRTADTHSKFLLSAGEGQGSKDTWCFSEETVEFKSMMHRFTEAVEIHRGSDLPSRVADNMLWLGRYVERTEGILRVVRSVLSRLNSETRLDHIAEFHFLMHVMSNLEIVPASVAESDEIYRIKTFEKEVIEELFGNQNSGSIRGAILNVKRVASSVRDRLSNDSWHILGRIENELAQFTPHSRNRISDAQELVNEMILIVSAFAGLALESMTRGMGWRFMDMGRRIERAGYMISLLQSLFSSEIKPRSHELEALLEIADSAITYHTRYRTTLQVDPIVDLLLLDELNPRAVGFQLASLAEHMETLPRSTPRPFRTREEKITLDLTTHLRLTDIHELMQSSHDGTMPKLKSMLEFINSGVNSLSNQITQHYLSRIETERQLGNFSENGSVKPAFSGGSGTIGYEI